MPYFHFPHFPFPNNYNAIYQPNYKKVPHKQLVTYKIESNPYSNTSDKKNNSNNNNDNYFFELFGLKLYFDDVLLICLIFFLYQEGVQDEELFISLILILLS